jgi:hypothetical protein
VISSDPAAVLEAGRRRAIFFGWMVPTFFGDKDVLRACHVSARVSGIIPDNPLANASNLLRALARWDIPDTITLLADHVMDADGWQSSDGCIQTIDWLVARGRDAAVAAPPPEAEPLREASAESSLGTVLSPAQMVALIGSPIYDKVCKLLANADSTALEFQTLLTATALSTEQRYLMFGLRTHVARKESAKASADEKEGTVSRKFGDLIAQLRVRYGEFVLAELAVHPGRTGDVEVEIESAREVLDLILKLDDKMIVTDLWRFSSQVDVVELKTVASKMETEMLYDAIKGMISCVRIVWGTLIGAKAEDAVLGWIVKYHGLDSCRSYPRGRFGIYDDIPAVLLVEQLTNLRQVLSGNKFFASKISSWETATGEVSVTLTDSDLVADYLQRRAYLMGRRRKKLPRCSLGPDELRSAMFGFTRPQEPRKKGAHNDESPSKRQRGDDQQKCFRCGETGHKKRDCPEGKPKQKAQPGGKGRAEASPGKERLCKWCGAKHAHTTQCEEKNQFFDALRAIGTAIQHGPKPKACLWRSFGRSECECSKKEKNRAAADAACSAKSKRDVVHTKADQLSETEMLVLVGKNPILDLLTHGLPGVKKAVRAMFSRTLLAAADKAAKGG